MNNGVCACVQVQSTMGTTPLAEVREAGRGAPMMLFQLYVFRDRAFTQRLVQRACPLLSPIAFITPPGLAMPQARSEAPAQRRCHAGTWWASSLEPLRWHAWCG